MNIAPGPLFFDRMVLNVPYTYRGLRGVREAAEICLKCGVCCAAPEYGCPAQYGPGFGSRYTYVYDCLGHDEPHRNPSIWLCVSCHKCEKTCPYEVSPIHFIETMKQLALEASSTHESVAAELEQVVSTGYAFPLTANAERQRQELGLEPLKATEELRRIAEATGLLRLLGRLRK